jgi:ElaB/YqjD/DUF883 family membrane-anchored ribosome-binding protein
MLLDHVMHRLGKLRSKIRRRWRKLTDEDMQAFDAGPDEFVDVLRERYGLSERDARDQLDRLISEFEGSVAAVAAKADRSARSLLEAGRDRLQSAWRDGKQAVLGAWDGGTEKVRVAYHDVEDRIRERPVVALAIAAGVGALIGMLAFRRR